MDLGLLLNGTGIDGSQATSAILGAPNVVKGGSVFPTVTAENPNTLVVSNLGDDLTNLSATISIIKLL